MKCTTSIMPMYKRRRAGSKTPYKSKKRSYAMVPRPLLNKERQHVHIVSCSTTTSDGRNAIGIQTQAGAANFLIGVNASPNMALSFSLAEMVVTLGGVPRIQIPMPNIAEMQQLYETFQVTKVEITMFFSKTDSFSTGGADAGVQWVIPLIGHAPDGDDAGDTSFTQLQQYSTFECNQLTKPIRRVIIPTSQGLLLGTDAATGRSRLQKQDIDVAVPATPHYGYKFSVDGFLSQPAQALGLVGFCSISARCHYLMKGTR